MSKKVFGNIVWSEETKNNTGLPRPYSTVSEDLRKNKGKKYLPKIVPIPWQSNSLLEGGGLLLLNQENEDKVFPENICGYCGIKINDSDFVVRWKTAEVELIKREGPRVFSDIHPLHVECMDQARVFCPFMRSLQNNDFESGRYFQLIENAYRDLDKVNG